MTIVEKLKGISLAGAGLPIYERASAVAGVLSRWVSSTETAGLSVATWEPVTGSVAFTAPTSSTAPDAVAVDGVTVIRTDSLGKRMTAAAPGTTVVYLVRATDPSGTAEGIVNWSGGHAQRGSNGTTFVTRVGASAVTLATSLDQPLFHTVTVINNGASSGIYVDAEYAAQAADRAITSIGIGAASSNYGAADFLEVATYDHVLTGDEHATLRSEFQTRYPGLVA